MESDHWPIYSSIAYSSGFQPFSYYNLNNENRVEAEDPPLIPPLLGLNLPP